MKNILHFILSIAFLLVYSNSLGQNLRRYVTPTGAGTKSGFNWANASNDLQLMINNLKPLSASSKEVWVAAGTYKPVRPADNLNTIDSSNRKNAFVLISGLKIFGGFEGNENLQTQRNWLVHETILSGDLNSSGSANSGDAYHVLLSVNLDNPHTEVNGFSIQHGYAAAGFVGPVYFVNGRQIKYSKGGGVYIDSDENLYGYAYGLKLYNNKIVNNYAAQGGAGIYSRYCTTKIDGSAISNNNTPQNGGGLLLDTASVFINITKTIFNNNFSGMNGGGIYAAYNTTGSSLTDVMDSIQFINNTALGNGGGIYLDSSQITDYQKYTNIHFEGNNALNGGAMYSYVKGDVELRHCNAKANNAGNNGGALFFAKNRNDIIIDSSYFENNTAITANSKGGAIFVEGRRGTNQNNSNYGRMLIFNSQFKNNAAYKAGGAVYMFQPFFNIEKSNFKGNFTTAEDSRGGAVACHDSILINNGSFSLISESTFDSNYVAGEGSTGGAIFLNATTQQEIITHFMESQFYNNFAEDGHGGAISIHDFANVTFFKSDFENNHCVGNGGAIYKFTNASTNLPMIERNIFINNNAFSGGALYMHQPTQNQILSYNVYNNVFAHNQSYDKGAAVTSKASINYMSCVFIGNKSIANLGAIAQLEDTATLYNSILYANNSSFSIAPNANLSANYNILQEPVPGVGNIYADPLFVASNNLIGNDNKWRTADDGLHLKPCSPAINKGNNDSIFTIYGGDFRGLTRINHGIIDIGAYESNLTLSTDLTSFTAPTATITAYQSGLNETHYADACQLMATVTGDGTPSSIYSSTTAKMWIEADQPADFVKRHYEITPDNNAGTATGRVTLYFSQAEFNAFNAVNTVKLPTNMYDATGKANLLIEKIGGVSSNGTGLPASYTGTSETINPNDADIAWDGTLLRWMVSFDVEGFSGFFVKTQALPLPLNGLSFEALESNCKAMIKWSNKEEAYVKYYELEHSTDGKDFKMVHEQITGNTTNDKIYTTEIPMLENNNFFRLKVNTNDGNFEYSAVVKLNNKCRAQNIIVYPNPATSTLHIKDGKLGTNYQIINVLGQNVNSFIIESSLQILDISQLPAGSYYLQSNTGTEEKFLKQ